MIFIEGLGLTQSLLILIFSSQIALLNLINMFAFFCYSQLNTDFVCWRGLLTKFLCTPYENREGWLVAITLFNGTYYLCEFETEQKKEQNASRTQRDDEMCCWGWKFEQYLTAGELMTLFSSYK
jgi:hypothetical protein